MSSVAPTLSVTPAAEPRRASRRRPPFAFILGLIITACFLLAAIAPGFLAPYDPLAFDYDNLQVGPSAAHWLGTDNFGRDVLSRIIWAARIDIQIALFCTIPPLLIGTVVGSLVGYYGGIADTIFGRIVDLVITFPFIVLVIAIVAVLGPGLVNVYIAVTSVGWVFYARLVRSEMMVLRQADFAAAGRVMGYSAARIIFRHLLPNAMTAVIVYWMTDMALDILLGSSLGYLGLGAQPPTAEWGVLVSDGKNFMDTAWWMTVFPGAAIVVCGTGLSLLGDGVADLLAVRR
jgi:peptide/nickel transport system permease protein